MIDYRFGVSLRKLESDESTKAKTFKWRNDKAIWRWCRQNDLISRAQHDAWFTKQASDPTIRMYGVHDCEGQLVGVCGLTSIDPINRRAEFSLYIGTQHQGVGFGRAALSTLLSHAFRNLGLHLVWGESFDDNPAMSVFESLGFKKEGVRRDFYFRDGKFIDAHLYSIKAEEWNAVR